MKLAIMQPYFFPYIGYWQLISAVDTFVIYDDVNYIKQGWINRNNIIGSNFNQLISLQVIGASSFKLINEIEVGNNSQKILKTIEQSYSKAPYFKEIFPIIEEILNQEEKNLAKFIGYSLEKISNYLKIDTKFLYSSSIKKDNSLKAQNKILDICSKLNAKNYINTIGGVNLYDEDRFKKEGIDLNFLKAKIINYQQFKDEFISHLSIIDVLMFNDIDAVRNMLKIDKLT